MDEARSIPDLLFTRAELAPDEVFLEAEDGNLTFGEAAAEVARWARGFRALGLERDDRVAFMLPNQLATPVSWLGAMTAGGIEVPLNIHHKQTLHEHVLADSEPTVLVVDPSLEQHLPGKLPHSVRAVVPVGAAISHHTAWPVCELPEGHDELPEVRSWDAAAIQYTSGTTGPTKGALSSHRFMTHFAQTFATAWHVDLEDVLFNPFPQFHSSGQVLGVLLSLATGARLVMDRGFSLSRYLPRVQATGGTVGFALGGMLSLIESLPESEADRDHQLRLVFSTPAPRDQVIRMERRFGFRVRQCYGSTEQGIPTIQEYDEPVLGSAGKVVEGIEVRIADEHDEPLPIGEVGEILVRSDRPRLLFSGYWNRPEATTSACRNFWFHTGDLGYLDEDGNLFFVDRVQDVIRRKGEFISAAELEGQLVEHPDVKEACAVGVEAKVGGQEVLVLVVPQDGTPSIDGDSVVAFCEQRLAYFMVPRYVRVVPELPKTENGKVRKNILREQGLTEDTWDREAASRRMPNPFP